MEGRNFITGGDVVSGYLTLTVPALQKTSTGWTIPKFLIKKTGGDPVCAANWDDNGPEELFVVDANGEEHPWEQDTDIDFNVSKEKLLYLLSTDSAGVKHFFIVKADDEIALRLHQDFQKGDQVVIFGVISSIGRNDYILAQEILKVETKKRKED